MDRKELTVLFERWYKPLRSNLRNHSSVPPAEIDDLAQEVFVRLLRYPDSIIISNPSGYLFTIGANIANEWRRLKRNRAPMNSEWLEELVISDHLEPQNIWEAEQLNSDMQRIIDAMPTRRGVILLMHVHDGMTYNQIAKELGLTYRLVLRELTKAYATLREEFFK